MPAGGVVGGCAEVKRSVFGDVDGQVEAVRLGGVERAGVGPETADAASVPRNRAFVTDVVGAMVGEAFARPGRVVHRVGVAAEGDHPVLGGVGGSFDEPVEVGGPVGEGVLEEDGRGAHGRGHFGFGGLGAHDGSRRGPIG